MKVRTCFVSNSSTSSFIVVGKDPNELGIGAIKLDLEQIKRINEHGGIEISNYPDPNTFIKLEEDGSKTYYLTAYTYNYDLLGGLEHYEYESGQHNDEPYDERYFNEYPTEGRSVYIRKEHDYRKQMSINSFVRKYKKENLPQQVLVDFKSDGVYLKYIYD